MEDRMDEVRDPALVFGPVLMRAVDTALPEDDGVHLKAAGVVPDVLVCSPLAAAVRTVEIDWLAFFTGNVVLVELSVHLVGRCENKRNLGVAQARGLEQFEGAGGVAFEYR